MSRSWGRWAVTLLAVLTGLAGLGRQPLWFDEVATDRAAGLSWAGLGHLLRGTDANLGAYYALVHVWRAVGDAPWALRLPSALAFVATVVVTERIGRRLLGPRTGLLGAGLLAVHPFATSYAHDARPYALVTLACTLALLLELQAREDTRPRRYAAFAAAAAPAVLLHLYAVLPLAAYGLALLPPGPAERRRRLLAHLAVGPVVLVVLTVSLHQQGQLAWVPGLSVQRVLSGLSLLSGGAAPFVATVAAAVWAARGGLPAPASRVLLAGVVLPVAGLLAASLVAPTFVPRYLAPTVPLQCLLLAAGAVAAWRRAREDGRLPRLATVAGVGVVLWLVGGTLVGLTAAYHYEDYRAAARTLLAQQRPGDGLVYEQQGARLGLEHYLSRGHGPGAPGPTDVLAAGSGTATGFGVPEIGSAAVAGALAPYRRLWLARHRDTAPRVLPGLDGFSCRPDGAYGVLELDLCRRLGRGPATVAAAGGG